MEIVNVTRKGGDVCIFHYSGELTLEVIDRLKREMWEYLENEPCAIAVMDLGDISFLDSSGIGFLVHLNNQRKEENKGFFLYRPSSQVRKSLSLVRLFDYFRVLEEEKELDKLAQ
jgi:anti-sigma B factor antagonist